MFAMIVFSMRVWGAVFIAVMGAMVDALPVAKPSRRARHVLLRGTRDRMCGRISYPFEGALVHLDGSRALERVNPRKFLLSGAFVFPDQPLIRIPQKTLDILLLLSATRIKKILVSPALLRL
jgi:hypothetical protein